MGSVLKGTLCIVKLKSPEMSAIRSLDDLHSDFLSIPGIHSPRLLSEDPESHV
jgi:hypothetical protein